MGNKYSSRRNLLPPMNASSSESNDNALVSWEAYQYARRDAVEQAEEILSLDPSGIVAAQKIAVKAWWRNKLHGSIYVVGLIALPILTLGFAFHALRGALFPAPIAENSKVEHRAGNATGRVLNTAWKAAKPGIAAVEVQLRQEGQSAATPTAPAAATPPVETAPEPVLTRASSSLVEVSNNAEVRASQPGGVATEGLDPQSQQAIEQFLK
ncbi:MAG: hypothetical protein SVX43_17545 [Cyanobacteriota bacterium]|nr:hypothetical protein [Cyanobacteriota bacterium]